jgi:CubicO group peptidase (beta-lactamase class C family)
MARRFHPLFVSRLALLGGLVVLVALLVTGRIPGGTAQEATAETADASLSDCAEPPATAGYPHAAEPIGTVRAMYDGALTPELAVATYRNIDRLFATRAIARGAAVHPLPRSQRRLADLSFSARGRTHTLADFVQRNRVAGLLILKDGQIVHEGCRFGNTARTRWMSMSVAKSVTSTLFGAALHEGLIGSLDDPVVRYVPRLRGSAYDGVTLRQVLTMTSGVRWSEAYADPSSDRRQLLEAQIRQEPGGTMAVMGRLPRAAPPGSVFTYSTGETQVAAEILTAAVRRPLAQYLSETIWARLGMEAEARWWLDAPEGVEIAGSGIAATLRDYGRFGLFIQNDGVIDGQRLLPPGWVQEAGSPKALSNGQRLPYGYLWWATGDASADGALLAMGIMGQQLYVHRGEKVVVVVWGAQTQALSADSLPVGPFFEAVVTALKGPA